MTPRHRMLWADEDRFRACSFRDQWKVLDTHTGLAIVGFAYENAVYMAVDYSANHKLIELHGPWLAADHYPVDFESAESTQRRGFPPAPHKEAT